MKVLNKQQLQIAEENLLKHIPRSLRVYGFIQTLNRNKPCVMEVVVDTWPDFKVIICRPDSQKVTLELERKMACYCMDEEILKKMLTEENAVDFSTVRYVTAFHASTIEVIKEVLSDKGINTTDEGPNFLLYLPDCSTLIRPAVDSELESKISCLNLSHVDLVNQTWKYGGTEETYKRISNLINNFPSCCITDDQGQPVSWILVYDFGVMGVLYTVPEHRGKGYAKVVIYTLAKRLLNEGLSVYSLVLEKNLISYRLFKSMGFIDNPFQRSQGLHINY